MSTDTDPIDDELRDMLFCLDEDGLQQVLDFAKMRLLCQTLNLCAEETPSITEWDSAPITIQHLIAMAADRLERANAAYNNLLKDCVKLKESCDVAG